MKVDKKWIYGGGIVAAILLLLWFLLGRKKEDEPKSCPAGQAPVKQADGTVVCKSGTAEGVGTTNVTSPNVTSPNSTDNGTNKSDGNMTILYEDNGSNETTYQPNTTGQTGNVTDGHWTGGVIPGNGTAAGALGANETGTQTPSGSGGSTIKGTAADGTPYFATLNTYSGSPDYYMAIALDKSYGVNMWTYMIPGLDPRNKLGTKEEQVKQCVYWRGMHNMDTNCCYTGIDNLNLDRTPADQPWKWQLKLDQTGATGTATTGFNANASCDQLPPNIRALAPECNH